MQSKFRVATALVTLCLASTAFAADPSQPAATTQPSARAPQAATVDMTQLPGAAQATLQREGRVTRIQEVSPKLYQATVTNDDGKAHWVDVNAAGTIITREPSSQ